MINRSVNLLTGFVQLTIRQYAKNDDANITSYFLPEDQAIYTSLPQSVVEASLLDESQIPFVIYSADHLVGCFALHTHQAKMYGIENPHALLLKSFSIDARHQKRGYALKTLQSLPTLTKQLFPNTNELVLTVHHTNIPAQQLYSKAGFEDKGMRFEGEYGEELIFHYRLP